MTFEEGETVNQDQMEKAVLSIIVETKISLPISVFQEEKTKRQIIIRIDGDGDDDLEGLN